MSLRSRTMDSLFDFDGGFSALGAGKQDDELLTADVDEDEYDALNDETFGDVGLTDGDDWEENHEKLAELDMKILKHQNDDDDIIDLNDDDTQQSIVEKSISQLGLDDLDDPAIMTYGRSQIQETLLNKFECSPFVSTVHILEDLENDLLNSSEDHQRDMPVNDSKFCHNQQNHTNVLNSSPQNWRYSPTVCIENKNKKENWLYSSSLPSSDDVKTVDDIEKDMFLKPRAKTLDEIERQLYCKKIPDNPSDIRCVQPPIGTPPQGSNIISPVGLQSFNRSTTTNIPFLRHSASQLRPQIQRFPTHPIMCPQRLINPFSLPFPPRFLNTIGKNSHIGMPFGHQNYRSREENALDSNMAQKLALQVQHLMKQQQYNINSTLRYPNYESGKRHVNGSEDPYSGLMTSQEKEWLIKIQMRQLQSDNPYLDDYYYTTFLTQKKVKEKKENGMNSSGEPKVLLPERTKHENRTYVPTQFEGSLGKLQVASVNNPRKILDLGVCRLGEDDDKSGSSHRFRYLLLSIEKLYTIFLEIEDEDKHILALPEQAQTSHLKARQELIDKLFSGFLKESNSFTDDHFVHIVSIRKGRNLAMRSLPYFEFNNQVALLTSLFRCLNIVLRKDQNDLILLNHCETVLTIIEKLNMDNVIHLAETIQNISIQSTVQNRERSNYSIAFQTKFGTTVVCSLLKRGQYHLENENLNCELHNRWTSVIIHIVDVLCLLPENLTLEIQNFAEDIISYLKTFPVDQDKFAIIIKKLTA